MIRNPAGIPATFVQTTRELHGEAGLLWLSRLPGVIIEYERRWSIHVETPVWPLSYNYVAPAVRADGTRAVLKACVPTREFYSEAAALVLYAGQGAARLLEADLEAGVLLLERLDPGTRLRTLPDGAEATSIAVGVMRQLWRPVPEGTALIPLSSWVGGLARLRAMFDGGTGPFPARLVEEAEARFVDLLASLGEPVVLHGDLHHDNILMAERQPWLAIDPKGVAGEAEYETAAWIQNMVPADTPRAEARRIYERCIAQLAEELGFERQRIRDWVVAQQVLGTFWMLEGHGHGWEQGLAEAEILAAIKV